jgi:acyl-CoA thioesterase-1
VFLGTSLTAGLGLEDPDLAYPGVLQARIDQARLPFRVVNAGVSGDTSAGGLRRLDWLLDQPVAVLLVELGANDGLRGLEVDALRENLLSIIVQTQARHPEAEVVILGMEAPPNLGSRYTTAFRQVYLDLASSQGLPLVPFLLDGVGGIPELNQEDGIHPTAEGHEGMADNVWPVLEPLLAARSPVVEPVSP